jgi:diamine N-acetyltransferase
MFLSNNILNLRALEPTDLEFLYKWENNPSIWEVSNTLVPYSKFILHQYIENSNRDIFESKQLRLIIELNSAKDSEPIGTIDLFEIDFYHRRAGIGILIANEKHRQKGFAAQSLNLIEEYSLNHLQLQQIHCKINADNIPSLKLFQSLGYEITGKLKDWKYTINGWKDVYILQHFL